MLDLLQIKVAQYMQNSKNSQNALKIHPLHTQYTQYTLTFELKLLHCVLRVWIRQKNRKKIGVKFV